MKKFFISLTLLILLTISIFILYLSFYGYQTDRFNKIIKTEIEQNQKIINLDFKKISFLLDIKKINLLVKFIDPKIEYKSIEIPIKSLKANLDLVLLIKNEVGIKNVELETNYIDIDLLKPQMLNLLENKLIKSNLKKLEKAKVKLKSSFNFDDKYKIENLIISGNIKDTIFRINLNNRISSLNSNFLFKDNEIVIDSLDLVYKNIRLQKGVFNISNEKNSKFLKGKSKILIKNDHKKIPIIKKNFKKGEVFLLDTHLEINKNNNIKIKNLILKDSENSFQIENVSLNDKFQLKDFKKIKVKTKDNNKVNNDFIIENKKSIKIKGSIFDASILLEEIDSNENKNNFLKKITKNIEIDFNEVMTSTDIPLNDFRLVGLIKKGSLEKISAKSEFSKDRFLDISLKKEKKTNSSVLEIYSDEAKPLVNGYEFFEGLEGGNLFFTSKTNKNKNLSNLEIENFKLNQAPGFAKLLSLADLRGLTDALKGEGISFDKLSIVYQIENGWMDIKEIFLIGPSISILVEGYFDKRKNILSLRGTLIPAKTLNSLVSKIPILGDILIGKKTGDGLFGVSFKIKGPTNNLKTTVNPVKTLTPRFITRTLEEYKKRKLDNFNF